MQRDVLVGLDLGTSGAKAGLFDVAGRLLALAVEEYAFERQPSGVSEIAPQDVWVRACAALRRAVLAAGVAPERIAAVGLSTIGETVMPLDARGVPLARAIESMDTRDGGYAEQVAWWQQQFGAAALFARTSYPLSGLATAAKVRWWQQHRPELYRTARFASFQEYAVWRLTGEPAIDYSMASRTMLFDVRAKRWIPEYLQALELDASRFSHPVESATPVGRVTPEAAEATGLPAGTLVVPGAHDQACAALGVGALNEGVAADGTGSVEAIVVPCAQPISATEMLAQGHGSQCHVRADRYLAIGFHLAAGSLVRWYRDQLGQYEVTRARESGANAYDLITSEAAAVSPPGANGLLVLPHFSGAGTGRAPALNPSSRGAIVGLTIAHTRADLARATFEGITYEARHILNSLEQSGIPIAALLVTGGGAKSPFWLQLKADITQKDVLVPAVTEASLMGAAMLAGVGSGLYADLEQAMEHCCHVQASFKPRQDLRDTYERMFAVYEDLYQAVLPLSQRLAALT